jgi:gliding motility-associated-like protein
MKRIVSALVFILVLYTRTYATHERAGEITYKHISGNTYEITVTTYTKESSAGADRCQLDVYITDQKSGIGDTLTFYRNNGSTVNIDNNSTCPYYGEPLGNDTKKNTYVGTYTFGNAGNYIIAMNDDNRNDNILNINNGNSVNVSFSLHTEIKINPFLGSNSSPVLLNPPIDNACIGRCFYHNPQAYDADGDSLSYSLASCYANGTPIQGWVLPANVIIDELRGTVSWCSPPPPEGLYNIGILIKEWRRLPGDITRYYIGSVLRDLQIEVKTCNNHPPAVTANDTCIVAGNNLHLQATAIDPDIGQTITLSATGGPLDVIVPKATFIQKSSLSPVTSFFDWQPTCKQVQLLPYSVLFKAEDNDGTNPLTGYKSIFIKVIAPGPTTLTAKAIGTSILLDWNDVACNDTLGNNPFTGYTVYKKQSCSPWVHAICETGVPASSGYTLIGTTPPSVTAFADNNKGLGLTYGTDYSYLVVANYTDGSQSYASTAVCAKLVRDVPIITNVSVISTGTNDSIWIRWIPPVAGTSNLDTIADPPIYEVRLMQGQGANASSYTMISSYTYSSFSAMIDTGFVSTGLNTRDSPYFYRVDFYSNGLFVGSSNVATSVYLTITPDDRQLTLSWQATVPWVNYKYYIYKETSPNSSVFTLLDSTTSATYTDTGLINRRTYCYKIKSVGQFSDVSIVHPLYNYSQIKCDAPVDKIPPCQPKIKITKVDYCETATTTITWSNPNTSCAKPYGGDAVKYNIYFATTDVGALQLIDSVTTIDTTNYTIQYLYEGKIPSVAGCYAVTAIDSSGNESIIVTKECVDNCPIYDLPNVFTPNDDGINDLYKVLIPYRYVKDIDIKIYNRWGTKLFETTNIDILWDGKNMANKKLCPDGVYYYVCIVNEIRLTGIVPHVLKGFIQLISENK